MINIVEKEKCCGCSACVQACVKGCITLKSDFEGFLYPNVDTSKCIKCGACEKVCPILNVRPQSNKIIAAYAAYVKNKDIRLKSSSGGIFSALSELFLYDGGIVIGAAFDNEFNVHHIVIKNINDLSKLQGSKYVQSNIENTYIEAEKNLKKGKKVLFTGTACQISGLKHFLNKEYSNLFLVDILCHGVPSPKLWRCYLNEIRKDLGGPMQKIYFRGKKYGWRTYSVVLKTNIRSSEEKFSDNPFMRLFLSNICLRPSCYSCKFKELERDSDITIGDCWGIERIIPKMDDNNGTSIVIVHTAKGQEIFKNIKEKICYAEGNINELLPPRSESRRSVLPHKKRDEFFNMLNQGESIEKLLKCIKLSKVMYIKNKLRSKIKGLLKKILIKM